MPFGPRYLRPACSHAQRGQAMLLVVLLFGMATALFVYGMVDTSSLVLRRDRETMAAFADVKRALIGWSVQRTSGALPNARPGELPCPDMNNDGSEDGTCAAGAIGRVPWKTLGIPEPKDAAGETLWYAIAGPFRIWNVNGNPINSDTKGNLTVYQDSTASAITTEAIAVIFAPGAVVGTQNRDCTGDSNVPNCQVTRICTGPTYALTARCNPANYLETAAGVNNSATNGPFISALSSGAFNDKAMAITTADLMPIVEQRVAREVRTFLQSYKAATAALGYTTVAGPGIYPWADCTDGSSDTDHPNRGRIPYIGATPVNWGDPGMPTLPTWYKDNNWSWVIYYSVGKNYLEDSGALCSTHPNWGCEPGQTSLSVNGVWGKEVVFFMTGPASVSRPLGTIGDCNPTYWTAYLDDSENNDLLNDRYVTPSSAAFPRDRLYTIP